MQPRRREDDCINCVRSWMLSTPCTNRRGSIARLASWVWMTCVGCGWNHARRQGRGQVAMQHGRKSCMAYKCGSLDRGRGIAPMVHVVEHGIDGLVHAVKTCVTMEKKSKARCQGGRCILNKDEHDDLVPIMQAISVQLYTLVSNLNDAPPYMHRKSV